MAGQDGLPGQRESPLGFCFLRPQEGWAESNPRESRSVPLVGFERGSSYFSVTSPRPSILPTAVLPGGLLGHQLLQERILHLVGGALVLDRELVGPPADDGVCAMDLMQPVGGLGDAERHAFLPLRVFVPAA